MSTPIHALRIDDETWGRWTEQARKRKLNMSDFIRQAVEDSLTRPPTGARIARAVERTNAEAVDRSVAARTLPVGDLGGPAKPDPRPTKKGRS